MVDRDSPRRLPPLMTSPPPAKRYKSESTPGSETGRSRYYHSQSVPSSERYHSQSVPTSERGRSRQTSTAMDIYVITDRDPAERDRRIGRFTSNGSVASHTSQISHASHSSPPVIISNHKYVCFVFLLRFECHERSLLLVCYCYGLNKFVNR